jgi:oligo-alginate lyase
MTKSMKTSTFLVPAALATILVPAMAGVHPNLTITAGDVAAIRAELGRNPLFDAEFAAARKRVDDALAAPIDVPVPKDAAGYTHERHKRNYSEMQLAGLLFQITKEARYADFVRTMLGRYADLYPTLGTHPAAKSSSAGRLFWQSLNETVWLVHVAQAYDCVYDSLRPDERTRFETNIFRPMAKFLSEERAHEFDRIHNHGTWTATAVGMIGYAMGDITLVAKALRGSKMDGSGGYLRQLDELFSPDGYYCEGPYYARYALMPFFLFAQVIDNNQPELRIFEHRDGILRKALYATLQQTNIDGAFLPFNDSLKEKTYHSPEVVLALDLTYARLGRDPALLSVARRQGSVALNAAGLEVARALAATAESPEFPYASVEFSDGADGRSGGVGILRSGRGGDQCLALLKYTAFGMEHGHYDKLALMFYDQGREIVPDYGAARFLNIEQKFGGRYLPENKTFALQTIAHNTVTVDERSHYRGSYETAEHEHSERHFFDARDPEFQVMSARDLTAVPGVAMQRTVALIRDPRLAHPVMVDVFRLVAAEAHRYDLPFYFSGQFLATNVELTRHATERKPFGTHDGYQHLWLEAEGQAKGPVSFTWFNTGRYYSLCSAVDAGTRVYFVRSGANDPNFNLRLEPAILLRRDGAAAHVFASVIEPHGVWDGTREFTSGGFPTIRSVRVLGATEVGTVVRIEGEGGLEWTLMLSNRTPAAGGTHSVAASGETFTWEGNAALRKR